MNSLKYRPNKLKTLEVRNITTKKFIKDLYPKLEKIIMSGEDLAQLNLHFPNVPSLEMDFYGSSTKFPTKSTKFKNIKFSYCTNANPDVDFNLFINKFSAVETLSASLFAEVYTPEHVSINQEFIDFNYLFNIEKPSLPVGFKLESYVKKSLKEPKPGFYTNDGKFLMDYFRSSIKHPFIHFYLN